MLLLDRIIKSPLLTVLTIIIFASSMLLGIAMVVETKNTYGYVEKATLLDPGLVLSAKLDTGAKSSSLSAINIQPFEKNGVQYLSFVVPSKDGDIAFEAEYVGKVKIKARVEERIAGSKISPIKRPIVKVRIQLGMQKQTISVNLTNRKRFIYPLLLGRDAIKSFHGIIDPSQVFTLTTDKTTITTEEAHKNEVK